jgi:hypothetical protein
MGEEISQRDSKKTEMLTHWLNGEKLEFVTDWVNVCLLCALFFRIVGVESKLGPLGASATSSLLYLPRMIVGIENLVELRLAGETEVLEENLP